MPFALSEDEQLIQKVVAEFARDRVGLDAASDFDRFDRVPEEPIKAAAELGLLAMTAPADMGGSGTTPASFALAIYELARVCPNTAAIFAVHNGLSVRALTSAAEPLRTQLLSQAATGQPIAFLASEEAHGSDSSKLGTLAAHHNGGFQITGQKVWGVAAAVAKDFIVLAEVAATKDAPGGPTLFHVKADQAGVSLGANESLLGLRGAGIRTVYFSKVDVPAAAVIGKVGEGLATYEKAKPWLQVGAAAALAGAVSGALAAAAAFAQTRVQFGSPIGMYQAVSDGVATIDVQLHASLALTLAAAGRLDSEDAALWAARAKAFAAEMAIPMTRQAIRIQGGTGFMREGGTERFARDVRALQFLGETVHMQRDLLKRAAMPDIEFAATP